MGGRATPGGASEPTVVRKPIIVVSVEMSLEGSVTAEVPGTHNSVDDDARNAPTTNRDDCLKATMVGICISGIWMLIGPIIFVMSNAGLVQVIRTSHDRTR